MTWRDFMGEHVEIIDATPRQREDIMTTRRSIKDAEQAVQRLAERMGVPYGHYTYHDQEPDLSDLDGQGHGGESPTAYKVQAKDGRWITTLPSGLALDHNPTYGGYVVEQIAPNGRTWISHPFGERRRSLGEFLDFIEGKGWTA